ncbi:MAG TPA: superoxide dismutase family protein [Candidatus Dormibacteraeota bacterium]|jgi:Cu-Zn family superoxide dismutase|nr:superoxide dismutase family protein [Candidatus Dormibacteraeota bacterium]
MKLVAFKLSLCAVIACFVAATCTPAQETHSHASAKPVTTEFKNAEGQTVGTATLSDTPHGVKIKLDMKGLPAGEHSIHIHQVAKCEAPDFKSAGPHFSPAGGMDHDHGSAPAGDIPDFTLIIAADGTAHVSVVAPNVTLGDDPSSVFSNGGTSIVIHAVSTPGSSSSPARIACAVIKKPM